MYFHNDFKDDMQRFFFRVTTYLENLEKSGNSKVVREKSGKMEKVREADISLVFSNRKSKSWLS